MSFCRAFQSTCGVSQRIHLAGCRRALASRPVHLAAGQSHGSHSVIQPATTSLAVANHQCRRLFATGTRGSRGHGWYVNYRAGKGGRHLQGEYLDRPSQPECQAWNDAILEMGKQQVYLDVVVEPRSSLVIQKGESIPLDSLTGTRHCLVMELAATVMPETTQNFVDLCLAETQGYKGSLLYRFEKKVGICGGDVLTNTGKTGQAAQGSPLTYRVLDDPLAMWHVAGVVTMLVPTVGDIDSRFILCAETAPHLDGIHRAFGRLTNKSLDIVKDWQDTLLTRNGKPTSYDLVVVDCGLLEGTSNVDDDDKSKQEVA